MKLNDFQKDAMSTAFFLGGGHISPIPYCALGLTEEAGEVAGKIKKMYRDNNGILTDEQRNKIGNELGDVLWYLSVLANRLGLTLEEVALLNIEKRQHRKASGTERGEGDER
jgi:NTP pyrophosphatase (non-canonical NTP hydrolase)